MRLCQRLLCDNAADVWWHGAWCAAHADERYGRVPIAMAEIALATARREVASQTRPLGGSGVHGEPLSGAASPPLTPDELLDLLERDGWHDVEADLFTEHRMTLDDLRRRCLEELRR